MEHAYFVGRTFTAVYPCDPELSVQFPDCEWYRVNKDIYLLGAIRIARLGIAIHKWWNRLS